MVYKLLWRGMSRGVGHFLAFRAMGKERIWAALLTVKDALFAFVRPCVAFSFQGGGIPHECRKLAEKRILLYHEM